jgi:hypothetical protein
MTPTGSKTGPAALWQLSPVAGCGAQERRRPAFRRGFIEDETSVHTAPRQAFSRGPCGYAFYSFGEFIGPPGPTQKQPADALVITRISCVSSRKFLYIKNIDDPSECRHSNI